MKFKDRDEPIYSEDLYYDLFEGGYITPRDLLETPDEYIPVEAAIEVVRRFLQAAEDNGILEIT